MEIEKTSIDEVVKYRADYLNSMPEFQELFVELMIDSSECYLIKMDNDEIGYAIRSTEGVLIEFYLINSYMVYSDSVFKQILKDLSIKEVYCKSFDSLLLNSCLLNNLPYSLIGALYRDFVKPLIKNDAAILMTKAGLSSVELLQRQDDSIKELFETEEQLTGLIQNGNVFLFYRNDDFIGCGMVLRTITEWDFCDLGVWVQPSKRGKGYGSQIIIKLREFAVSKRLKPSCGCAIENVASQRAIEKSGFVSRYKLLSFNV